MKFIQAFILSFLVLPVVGCVTGGQRQVGIEKSPDGSWKATASGNDDAKFGNIEFNGPEGVSLKVTQADMNGSNLGAMQLQLLLAQTAATQAMFDKVLAMLPLVGGLTGGGFTLPTSPPVATTRSLAGQAIIDNAQAKLAACPFIPLANKPALSAYINATPIGQESVIQSVVDQLTKAPATQP